MYSASCVFDSQRAVPAPDLRGFPMRKIFALTLLCAVAILPGPVRAGTPETFVIEGIEVFLGPEISLDCFSFSPYKKTDCGASIGDRPVEVDWKIYLPGESKPWLVQKQKSSIPVEQETFLVIVTRPQPEKAGGKAIVSFGCMRVGDISRSPDGPRCSEVDFALVRESPK